MPAITYPINTPDMRAAGLVMRARSVVSITASPFTGEQQVQVYPGQWWEADITIVSQKRTVIGDWIAFLLKLNGMEGRFYLVDPSAATPLGSAASAPGTPLINGAGQSGNWINIDGLPAGAAGYLLASDYISIEDRLYRVLEDVNAESTGTASVVIWPSLRSSPANNAVITVSNPRGVFRLSKNVAEWSVDEAMIHGLEFSCMEAL